MNSNNLLTILIKIFLYIVGGIIFIILLIPYIILVLPFQLIFGINNQPKTKKKYDNSIFNLSKQEQDEVKTGFYDPENFEEDDLEEDDYYYNDEK